MVKISVVIPVFNEELLINELIKRVTENILTITKMYEVIIIDDGSVDKTWLQIQNEVNKSEKIKGIRFSKNFGHHYAITAGLNQVIGEWTIVMDGDLQDRPEVIPKLYQKAIEGYDIVFVSRKNRPESNTYKILQKIYYIVLRKLSGIDFDYRQANYSIISQKVVQAFNLFPETARFYGSTIKWLGFNRTYIEADHGQRFSGSPSYSIRKRIRLALDIIFSFSERPLKFSIYLGAIMSIGSIICGLFLFYRYLRNGFSVEGWASIIISIYLLSGIILLMIGVFGIYLGRVFTEVKKRPLYIIAEQANPDNKNNNSI